MYSLFLEKDSKKIILSQGHLHCIYSKRSSRQKKKNKKTKQNKNCRLLKERDVGINQ